MTRREFLAMTAAMTASPTLARGGPGGVELPRRKLGRTGETVSALGLGGFHVGKQADRSTP